MIALVDYGAGNLTSVRKALAALGAGFWTPASPDELGRAVAVIVPGVGHFGTTAALDEGWRSAVMASLDRGAPLLGICVGMQWLFQGSTEAPGVPGLGLIGGTCVHLGAAVPDPERLHAPDAGPASASGAPLSARIKVPHVGWNALEFPRSTRLFEGLPDGTQVYFTHSYAAPVVAATAAICTHGVPFTAAVETGLVSGVQFHPEKSGDAGLRILANWLAQVPAPATGASAR